MVIRPVRFHACLLAAVLVIGAVPSCPALAQYGGHDDNYSDDPPDYQSRYDHRPHEPRCHYVHVRVYDEDYGNYVTRRQRVCDDDD
jgi:hypothetical protein